MIRLHPDIWSRTSEAVRILRIYFVPLHRKGKSSDSVNYSQIKKLGLHIKIIQG